MNHTEELVEEVVAEENAVAQLVDLTLLELNEIGGGTTYILY